MQTKISKFLTYSVAVAVSGMVNAALVYGFLASEAGQATAAMADTSARPATGAVASAADLDATDLVARIIVVGKRPATAVLADAGAMPAARPIAGTAERSATDCPERIVVVGKRRAALERVVVIGTRPVTAKSGYGIGALSAPQPSTP